MIDIATFVLIKIGAVAMLFATLAIPLALSWIVLEFLGPTSLVGKRIWYGVVGTTIALALIVYASWVWPGGYPRNINGFQHMPAAAWNNLIDSMDEQQVRWGKPPPVTRTSSITSLRRFELVNWNPPKHFYVTLKDVETGQRYESIFVSKHCNAHGQLKRGDQYNLRITYFALSTRPGEHFYEFVGLYEAFCGS